MRLADLEDIYELTPMQQGMMFHTLLAPESGQYFEQLVCDLEGQLDVEAFRRAWECAVRNHSIFRTSFVTDGSGKPVQVVHREVALPFELSDWRSLPPKQRQSREAEFLLMDRERGFELARPPLMRLSLFRLEENLHRFIWSRHHLLTDAWSRSLVFDEVFSAYEAFRAGLDFHPPARRPYGDYIAWLQEQDLAKAERYWRRLFEGFEGPSALEIGPAPESPRISEDIYFQESLRIPAPLTAKLRAIARQQNLTFNTFVQGAWGLLLGRYSDRDDVVFGATVAGRPPDLEGVESMIGLFVNTLPIRVRMPADAGVAGWLNELQGQQAELREYEYSPLVEIQRWSGIPPGRPLFDTLLVFENAPRVDASTAGERSLRVRNTKGYGSRTNYPLSLLVDVGAEIDLLAVADSRLYDRGAIQRLLGHLRTVMEAMASRPDIRIEDLPLLTEAEQRQVLVEWNETAAEYPRDQTIHRMFEAQVEKSPERAALFFENGQWTFRELNGRANQLARFLKKREIGRGDLVGISVERSPEMVCALLAALKTGAAYLPLDPAYPKERLAFILRDSGARVAIVGGGARDRLPAGVTELV
ncbi:MAG TPA: condensation domain-containing protein, partial [Thermoanaerobaculia bacterium]